MFENFWGRLIRSFVTNNGWRLVLDGLGVSMQITLVALVIGIVLGTLIAICKVTAGRSVGGRILNSVASLYITFFRGTPVVVQLLLFYFGIFAPMGVSALAVACVVFGLNSGAYVAEIVRSGIMAVDRGQMEAGRSLGLSRATTMRRIILPQALKNILPALGNEVVVLIKETSVAGWLPLSDMTRAIQKIISRSYDAFVPYLVLALIYLVIVVAATYGVNRFERWMRRSER